MNEKSGVLKLETARVLIYINNNLRNISVEQQPLFSEASCLKISLKANNKQITILATYRSPKSNINIFLSELNTLLTSGVLKNNCIWIGDINIDILALNTSLSTENYLNILSSNGFISQICTYTREVNETKSCIDHLFSRDVHLNTVVIKTIQLLSVNEWSGLFETSNPSTAL
ncbi:otoferlin-like, partial [Aphis craccivora]